MTNKYDRSFLLDYVQSENINNGYNVSLEDMNKVVDLIQHFGIELYRPITRLLLSNWHEISERIEHYSDDEWAMAHDIQRSTPNLDRFSIAMLMEVLEGEDTLNQGENVGRRLTDAELRAIRKTQDD